MIQHCLEAWSAWGKPRLLKTDNGPAYTSQKFQQFCRQMDVTHLTGLPISNTEMLLSSGGDNSDLRQKNVIEIKYLDEAGDEFVVRNEMLTGFTVMGQEKVCLEMLDLLRTKGIMKQFKGTENSNSNNAFGGDDVLKQIEKLAALKDSGIITEDEFNQKKVVLLEKL